MTRKQPTKFIAPKKGDMADKRCAFVTKFEEPTVHSRITVHQWCSGCLFYICDHCNEQPADFKKNDAHDVVDHSPDEVVPPVYEQKVNDERPN